MYVRIHVGTLKPGAREQARAIYDELAPQMVAQYPACRAVYRLEQGDRFVGLSFWSDRDQMDAYARSELARSAHAKLEPHVVEHSVAWYDVVRENLPAGVEPPFR